MRTCSAKGCTATLPDDRKDKCCQRCRAAYSAKWRADNPERSREISRESKQRERTIFSSEEERREYLAKQREIKQRWRKSHPDEAKALARAGTKRFREKKKVEDPSYGRAGAKRWREKNPERNRAIASRSREKRRDAFNAERREARRARPEPFRKRDRERYERDRFSRILQSEKMRARRAGATGSHTVAEWKSVLRHYHRKCVYCGLALTRKTISKDHRIPLSKGGTNNITNIVPACRSCNSKKHTRTYDEYMSLLVSVGSHQQITPQYPLIVANPSM